MDEIKELADRYEKRLGLLQAIMFHLNDDYLSDKGKLILKELEERYSRLRAKVPPWL